MQTQEKYENLKNIIKNYGNLAVAFSGGMDSTFLLKTAHDVLGDNAVAVTACPRFFTEKEKNDTVDFCKKENIKHILCDTEELKIEGVAQNHPNRCYLCKNEILTKIKQVIAPFNIKYILEGSHMDDEKEYRPGFQAVQEHGIKSPLKEAGLTKDEIRELSKNLGLSTWNKQYFSCLASRFPYGETITEEKLRMVEKAENLLRDLGFAQMRVRIHGTIARIEINPEEFKKITEPEISQKIYSELKQYGFTYVTLDLCGYRTGSMDEFLSDTVKSIKPASIKPTKSGG